MKRRSTSVVKYLPKKFKKSKYQVVSYPRSVISSPRLPTLWQKLIYNDYPYSLNPGAAGAAAVHVFSANGLYDVDVTGVGHQPVGFDQFMAIYQNYVVTDAYIEVEFTNNDTTHPVVVGIAAQDIPNTVTDSRRYIENGNCVSKTIGNAGGATANIATLKMRLPLKDYFRSKNLFVDDTFQGSATANPVDQAYFHVFVAALDTGVDAGATFARVTIVFNCMFRSPTINNLS